MADPFQIRPARLSDVPAVHAIEQEVFADPWSSQDFRDCVTSDAHFLVVAAGGTREIAGYVVALDAADEGEILNLAVAPGGRRHGLGRALVHSILEALTARGVRQGYLQVRESNAPAQRPSVALRLEGRGTRPQYLPSPVGEVTFL